jgi:glycosyltransferase involved in cell wall biosynthesis
MISLIATVLNEGESIRRLMDSILKQTCQPDEIVIVDGGSTDNTVAILQSYVDQLPLHVYVDADCNISRGRNAAIEAAQGDIIAVTDAGVGLPDNWLEHLTKPLLDDANVQVVGGFFRAAPQNVFEAAMGATVLPLRNEIKTETFLPSSRSVAFRKAAWDAVDGYPEWLDYCEDLVFDLRLKERYGSFAFAPDAVVDFRPRGSLEAFFKQYYLYARGDGKADLWRKRHAIRYATYLGAIPLILMLALYVHPLLSLLYIPGAIFYLYQPYRRLPVVLKSLPTVTPRERLRAIGLVPVIRVVGDIAKMLGYPEGWQWRRQLLRELPEQTPKSV